MKKLFAVLVAVAMLSACTTSEKKEPVKVDSTVVKVDSTAKVDTVAKKDTVKKEAATKEVKKDTPKKK